MAEISFVPFDEIESSQRWDSEYFRPYFRKLEARLFDVCKHKISDYASPSVQRFDPSKSDSFSYVEISDIDLSIGRASYSNVPTGRTPDRAQFLMKGGEILISTVRPNRSGIGLLPDTARGFVASSGFLPLLAIDEQYRSYLFVWFKLPTITDWLDRCSKASMYPAVSPADILNTPFAKPSPKLINEIHLLVTEMQYIINGASSHYSEAEQELLERIGIQRTEEAQSELFFIEQFSNVEEYARADAEYFQPKYKRLRAHLAKNSLKIGDFCPTPSRGVSPVFDPNGDVWVLASKSIRSQGVLLDEEGRTDLEFYEDHQISRALVHRGDVLLNSTGVGTLGRASFYLEEDLAIADNHVAILKPKREVCHSVYLSLFLNSLAGKYQSEMFQTGSSGQLEIYPQHIEEILVFLPRNQDGSIDIAWQKKLAQKVIKASTAKQDAQAKLEEARKLIEKALRI